MKRTRLAVILFAALGAVLPAQGPATMDEVMVLLEAGVPSEGVLATLERIGGPVAVTHADLDRAAGAGADKALVAHLEKRLDAFRRLARLASRFGVHEDAGFDVNVLVPSTPEKWAVSRRREGQALILSMQPEAGPEDDWLAQPRICVWVHEDTRLPAGAENEIAGRIGGLVKKRLRREGFEIGTGRAGIGELAGANGPERSYPLTVARAGWKGSLTLRTRVLPNGTMVTAALAVADSERSRIDHLFDEVARHVEVARRHR